jgi:hypothetical protein
MDLIRVVTERRTGNELAITTILASRHGDWAPPLPPATTAGVTMEYQIYAPANTKLVIHHGAGVVLLSNMAADMDVTVSRGDIMLLLPDSGKYSVDARTRLGVVASDLPGVSLNRYGLGQRFTGGNEGPLTNLRLRTGFGGITLKLVAPGAYVAQ